MGRSLEKRRTLFRKFSSQLLLLQANGLIDRELQYPNPYLCPICLREFSEDHLDESNYSNFLTAEDAPPFALGGSKVAMTCRECNNRCGQQIDCHLVEALRGIDESSFYKGSKLSATIMHEGRKLTVELEALGDGTLTAYHRIKHNDPSLLEKFIFGIKNKTVGPLLNFEPPTRKAAPDRIQYALLKTNYIISFAKFGYLFLLDAQYDVLRQQLLHPEQRHYPWNPFIKDHFTAQQAGTYYILNEDMKAILNVFVLKTPYSQTVIAGFIQSPSVTMAAFAETVDHNRGPGGVVIFENSAYDPQADLFANINEMLKVSKWIR